MTTGSFTKDERKRISVFSRGSWVDVDIGLVSSKNWSGQDWGPTGPPSLQRRAFSLVQEPASPVNVGYPKVRGATGRPPKRTYNTDHPYTMSSTRINHSLVVSKQTTGSDIRRSASVSRGAKASFSPPVWGPNDQIKLIGKLSDKIAGSDFNLGVFLGEGREALGMMASSATRVYTALRSLKRGDIPNMYRALTGQARGRRYNRFRQDGYLSYDDFELRELRRNQRIAFLDKQQSYDRDLSALWLEAQYGWKPLLQDIHGAAAYVAERLERSPERVVRVRSRIQKDYTPGSQSANSILLNGRSVVSKSIIARIKSENATALTGLMDVSSVAWELLPWSFVIDWALPIGSYLKARNFAGKVNATYVVSTLAVNSWRGFKEAPNTGWTMVSGYDTAWESNATLTREVLTSLSVPMPTFKPLSQVASWVRAGNALALLDQLRPRS